MTVSDIRAEPTWIGLLQRVTVKLRGAFRPAIPVVRHSDLCRSIVRIASDRLTTLSMFVLQGPSSTKAGRTEGLPKPLKAFACDAAGSVALVFSITAPVILVMAGAVLDYSKARSSRGRLQTVVDSATIMGGSALRLANSSASTIQSLVNAQIQGAYVNEATLSIQTTVSNTEVLVVASLDIPNMVMKMVTSATTRVTATARSRVVGGLQATCIVVLDPSASKALDIDTATLSAPGCRVVSDSTDPTSIAVSNSGQLRTASACSSGGFDTKGGGTYNPQPTTDCPPVADPLAGLAAPTVGATCDVNKGSYKNVTIQLVPGVYCGGLKIDGADVTLQSGTYIIKDGPLEIPNGSLKGAGVTLFFTGDKSILVAAKDATLDLTAPSFGPQAGILFFEDRTVALGQTHKLNSRYAANLLGTIYLSRSSLAVGAKGMGEGSGNGVASASAWTIAVVRQLQVNDQQTLTFNANYGATSVPPPGSLVSMNSSANLVQ